MANLSKIKRDRIIAFLEQLKEQHNDDDSIRAFNEIENHLRDKKYGLVWEEHTEQVDELLENNIPVFSSDNTKRLCVDADYPWNFIIEGDNLQALYLLEKTHKGKIDCIYIDPPYNNRNRSWKYNNDYVDNLDAYKHSKWLSLMERRLNVAKSLLNPEDSVLIVTIDEKEYLHLGCLLEELFPNARIQMVTNVISAKGVVREGQFSRVEEYIFFVELGSSAAVSMRYNMLDETTKKESDRPIEWLGFRRRAPQAKRPTRPHQFYPIFVNKETGRISQIGDFLTPEVDRNTVPVPDGCIALWPLSKDGDERMWSLVPEQAKVLLQKGFLKVIWNQSKQSGTVYYLPSGTIEDIETGVATITGREDDGSVMASYKTVGTTPPKRVWNMKSHNAETYGSNIIRELIGNRFDYPKSLYAVRDTIKFFVADKPNAIILDYFAGSGTTLHAVNLLNKEDGGKRKCIMVTNNEMSEKEEIALKAKGLKEGDPDYDKYGVAQYVTWPRTVCSITGQNIHGKKLSGTYGVEMEVFLPDDTGKHRGYCKKQKVQIYPELASFNKSDGFVSNVKFFKCAWTPRKPEDYLLSNVLSLHIKEMIELQNHIEIDYDKNVLLMNKDDIRRLILDPEKYKKIERIWINQNIILNAEEMKLIEAKQHNHIPKSFFGQELKEAAE